MAKKTTVTNVDEIRPTDIGSFKRTENFETAKTNIQIFLMGVLALALFVFLALTIVAGVTEILPNTRGVQALATLFEEIAANAKAVTLFALGFFFREYLIAKNSNNK